MENKDYLRKQIQIKRNQLTPEEKNSLSNKIFHHLIHSELFSQSDSIFTYISFENEVDTRNIIHYSLKKEKMIGIPKISEDRISPIVFKGWDTLKKGYSGILEPQNSDVFQFSNNTIILIPGLVFDKNGHRLGYGKGFYDRFLKNHNEIKIGLSYSFQITDNIFPQNHDIPMDYIITEKEIFVF